MSFIQSKKFNYEKFTSYLEDAEKTNQWANYGHAVQILENRARQLLKISDEKAIIATCNGTAALHAIILCIRLKNKQDLRVTTQNFTFPSASTGPCSGPIVIDFDENLNVQIKDEYLINYGAILIVTNCFGHLQNIDYIKTQSKKLDKILIFDNAATPYSFYNNINSCNYGTASFISLHHTKPIGFGEGGLVIIDKKYEKNVREAINFGYDKDYNFNERSSNFKMSELAAAGILQWWDQFDIDEMVKTYQKNYYDALYKLQIANTGNPFPNHSDDTFLPFILPWIYDNPVKIEDSYFKKVISKKYYKPLRYQDAAFPISNQLYERILCYPIHGDIVNYE